MKEKNISVVIPAYNSEHTIEKILRAIINQTGCRYIKEVIVIDDGSKDNTAAIVEDLSRKSNVEIRLVSQENKGVSTARNNGMRLATGEWVAFCDSDDLWLENKIEVQVNVINENDEIDFLGCSHQSKALRIGLKRIKTLHKGTVAEILFKNYPHASTVLFKRRIFEETGGFDEEQRYAEDGNWFLKICAQYNLYYWPEQLVYYGDGKRGFGVSGLSANLKGMHEGNIKNLDEMRTLKYINSIQYWAFRCLFQIKYIRRIILTKKKK